MSPRVSLCQLCAGSVKLETGRLRPHLVTVFRLWHIEIVFCCQKLGRFGFCGNFLLIFAALATFAVLAER
jgi:hypothetical protein